ncbi:MAG: hypothetical protein WD016_03920 [Balneolaceae bacterium]
MKVGIIGDAKRAVAWEQHLRPHRIVHEVDLCPTIQTVGEVDACFLIDESPDNLHVLLEGIQMGLNCFLISKPPSDKKMLEKIHQATREAGVHVQLSHWPTLAPATQWMMDRINRPSVISIIRQVSYSQFSNLDDEFKQLWMDELGLCIKWVGSGIHHLEAKEVAMSANQPLIIHLFLRFDNGASADIRINVAGGDSYHQRLIATKQEVLECNVPSQTIRIGRLNSGEHLFFEKQVFDPAKSAEKAALMFLKSIQMNKETAYTSYDAYQLALQVERIEQRLKQFS